MIGKKINQLATELAPDSTDLTIIGDPISGVSKKITLAQLGAIFSGAVSFYTNLAAFPVTGDINVIYCAKDTQKLYLWSGSAYTEVFPSQALLNTYQLRSEKGNANGYASLDSLGKVPIAQLPSSLMEYKGTWNAATNTPTLANGTGDTGDVYICNVAGTVNFGAGALTFAVGDYVIYSGTIWQRSSGAVGTVTSVAASITGNSIGISGSPITTSGTLALAFSGTSAQYINGAGNLITFPTFLISGSGASGQVTFFNGANSVTGTNNFFWDSTNNRLGIGTTTPQRSIEIFNSTADNHLRLSGNAPSVSMGEAVTGSIYQAKFGLITANGQFVSAGVAGDFLILSQTGATIFATNSTEKMRISITGNMSVGNTNNTYRLDVTGTARLTGQLRLESTITDGTYTYTLPSATGTLALTSQIPSLTGYVPYTGATANVDLGTYTLSAYNLIINHTSGSGVAASITKGGNGEALTVVKSSGSGNAASITGGVTLLSELHLTTDLADAYIASASNWNDAYNLRHNAVTIGTANGLSLSTQVLSLALASGSTTGALSSTDWTTFNNKQSALTNPVTGTGTTNYLPKFTGTSTIGNSIISESGTIITVAGSSRFTGFDSGYYNENVIAIGNGTNNPKIGLASTSGYRWNTRIKDVGGNGEYVIRYEEGSLDALIINRSGNLGLGVTPSAWDSGQKVYQSGLGSFYGLSDGGATVVVNNGYYNAGWKFSSNSSAAVYQIVQNSHQWLTAPSGTEGNAISFTQAMTLNASGNLSIGQTSSALQSGGTGVTLYGASASEIKFLNSSTGSAATDGTALVTSGLNFTINNREAGDLIFGTSNTTRLTIASTGAATFSSSVTATKGILGSTSATSSVANLEVFGSTTASTNNGQIRVNDSVTTSKTLSIGVDGANNLAFLQSFQDGVAYRSLILNGLGGNVGIGTTSPTSPLHVGTGTIGNQKIQHWGEPGFVNDYGLILRGSSLDGVFKFYGLNNGTETTNPILSMSRVSGNVGIGTTSPQRTLSIANGGPTVEIDPNGGAAGPLYFNYNRSTSTYLTPEYWALAHKFMVSGGTLALTIASTGAATFSSSVKGQYFNVTGTNGLSGYLIQSGDWEGNASADLSVAAESANLRFYTNGSATERMRITSGGNVGINTTSPSYTLDVNGTARFGSVIVGSLSTGTVYSNAGTLTNTNPSDQRLKNTIKTLSYGLKEVLKLNPKTFYYNDDATRARLKYGFIAQEVKGIMPELVRRLGSDNDYLGLETEGIYVTLVNAIKELKAELDTLKNK